MMKKVEDSFVQTVGRNYRKQVRKRHSNSFSESEADHISQEVQKMR
jgi:hypothetical protein